MPIWEIDPEALKALPPAEKKRALAELKKFQKLVEANPLWRYEPHPKQAEYHLANQYIAAFIGGNRSGKTTAGVVDDIIQAVDRAALPPWLAPYKRWEGEFYCRIVVPDLVSTLEGVLLPTIRSWVPKEQLYRGSWDRAYDGRRRRLTFANGSWFDFLTHTMELDQFAGAALHRVHFDEEPPGNKGRMIFNESIMRTIDYGGEVRFSMTPLFGLSWTYHELTTRGVPRNDDEVKTVTVDMDDNPHLDPVTKKRALAGLSESERMSRKSGLFVHFAGKIFPQFDRDVHVIPYEPIPGLEHSDKHPEAPGFEPEPSVPIYVGIDPGIDHPTAIVWAWVDTQDRMVVFKTIKVSDSTVGQIATMIATINEEYGIHPHFYVIDPSAKNRNQVTGRNLQMEFADHGLVPMLGQNDRRAGINRMRERLETDRLLVMADCEDLVEEFEEYRWKKANNTDEASQGREEPIKVNDDLLDALRYIVMARPHSATEDPPEEHIPPMARAFRQQLARLSKRPRASRELGAIFQ